MKLTFMLIGKAREPFMRQAYGEYLKRLAGYAETSLIYVGESYLPASPSESQISKALEAEGRKAMLRLGSDDYVFLLDVSGRELTSAELAGSVDALKIKGRSSFVFVIGSSYGVGECLRKRADFRLSLSTMTFTHPLALLIVLEQVYRAMKINAGEAYDK